MQGAGLPHGLYILKVELCSGLLQTQTSSGSQVSEDSGHNFSKTWLGPNCVPESSPAAGRARAKPPSKIWKAAAGGWNTDQPSKASL